MSGCAKQENVEDIVETEVSTVTQKTIVRTGVNDTTKVYTLSGEQIGFQPKMNIGFTFKGELSAKCDSYEKLSSELSSKVSSATSGDIIILGDEPNQTFVAAVLLSEENVSTEDSNILQCEKGSYTFLDFNEYLESTIGSKSFHNPTYVSVGIDNKGVILLILKEKTDTPEDIMASIIEMFEFPEKETQKNYIEGLD